MFEGTIYEFLCPKLPQTGGNITAITGIGLFVPDQVLASPDATLTTTTCFSGASRTLCGQKTHLKIRYYSVCVPGQRQPKAFTIFLFLPSPPAGFVDALFVPGLGSQGWSRHGGEGGEEELRYGGFRGGRHGGGWAADGARKMTHPKERDEY